MALTAQQNKINPSFPHLGRKVKKREEISLVTQPVRPSVDEIKTNKQKI